MPTDGRGSASVPRTDAEVGQAIQQALDRHVGDREQALTPGAVVVVEWGGHTVVREAHGWAQLTADGRPERRPMDTSIRFDLASITKGLVTTAAVMRLVGDGRLDLDTRVTEVLPAFQGPEKADLTLAHLLSHTSGLPPWAPVYLHAQDRDAALDWVASQPLVATPGQAHAYSDLGFMLLGGVLEAVTGQRLDTVTDVEVVVPLGLTSTAYLPRPDVPTAWVPAGDGTAEDPRSVGAGPSAPEEAGAAGRHGAGAGPREGAGAGARKETGAAGRHGAGAGPREWAGAAAPDRRDGGVAATSHGDGHERTMIATGVPYPVAGDPGDFDGWREHTLVGEVNDGNAWHAFGGIAGHAGAFATVDDVATFARHLLDGAMGQDNALAPPSVVDRFCQPIGWGRQALGWWRDPGDAQAGGRLVGHSGFTGGRVAVDPTSHTSIVLLANRQHLGHPAPDITPLWRELVAALPRRPPA